MHPIRKKRLMIILFIMTFSAIGISLMVFSLKENMNLFFSPSAIAKGEAPYNKTIRVGGYVVKGSLTRDVAGLDMTFILTDGKSEVEVSYRGILPDLFSEGEAAVAKGILFSKNKFVASEVLAKHDENYTPPEIQQTAIKPSN